MIGSVESRLCLARFLRQKNRSTASKTRNATPPTVPPTIAPTGVLDPPPPPVLSWLEPPLPLVPPDEPPPTPETLALALGAALVAVPAPEPLPPARGDVSFIHELDPPATVISGDEPPVTLGPASDIAKRYSVPSSMLTCQSYDVPSCGMGIWKAVPPGMRPKRLTGRVTLDGQETVCEEHCEGFSVGEIEKVKL